MQKSIWSAASEVLKYNSIRPDHPVQIVDNVIKFLRQKFNGDFKKAVDVGCGTGMSTKNLFGKFEQVLGVDLSEAMVEEARQCFSQYSANVTFEAARAEAIPVPDNSTQLILVGRAIHYFDQKTFFEEVDRILVTNGVVAYYSVHFPTVIIPENDEASKAVNDIFWDYLDNKLSPFWPHNQFDNTKIGSRNRRDYYVNGIVCPFKETEVDETISYEREMTLAELARELDTYGGAVRHRDIEGNTAADDMIAEFKRRALNALGSTASPDDVNILTKNSFFVVMKRKSA